MAEANVADETKEFTEILRLNRRLKAPREAVFRAFTDPVALAKWFGPEGMSVDNVKIDLRPGGAYSMVFKQADGADHGLSGIYREISPPQRLVMTWVWDHGEMAGIETLVTIGLTEANGETDLTLVHEKLPNQDSLNLHDQGWASTLTCLDRLIEESGLS